MDSDGSGRDILAGGLTLAVLVLPIVIITSAEALRAVPNTIREAGYGVGASRWEVTRQLVLPYAAPGILTGTVLALARALGETAPLILVGAVLGSFSGLSISTLFTGSYTALPVIVYDWARKPRRPSGPTPPRPSSSCSSSRSSRTRSRSCCAAATSGAW